MDLQAKKNLLRKIPYGLFVIGVKAGDQLHAFTGSWLSQISMNPPAVILGVRKKSKPLPMIRRGKVLTINFIRKENKDTVAHFFKSVTHHGNKLGHYHFHTDQTGAPILDEAIGYLECRVKRMIGGFGDHIAVIAEVIHAKEIEITPSLIMSDTPWHYGG